MRVQFLASSLILSSLVATAAQASIKLQVVTDYASANNAQLWKSLPFDTIPRQLVSGVVVDEPSAANKAPFANVYLQNELFVVCVKDCSLPQPQPTRNADGTLSFLNDIPASGPISSQASTAMRAENIYYWLTRLFGNLKQIGFTPQKRLRVLIDAEIDDINSGVATDNNAEFIPYNWTLNFLPAFDSTLGKAVASSFDPSVGMHEATHSVFQALIGSLFNESMLALHEAFADYFSLDTLENPEIGQIMLRGTSIRSDAKIYPYNADMLSDPHNLGNTVTSALWQARTIIGDKRLAGKIALATISQIGKNPYAVPSDVIATHLSVARAAGVPAAQLSQIAAAWASTQIPVVQRNKDASMLRTAIQTPHAFTIDSTLDLTDKLVAQYGMDKHTDVVITIAATRNSNDAKATWIKVAIDDVNSSTPFWLLYDPASRDIIDALDGSLTEVTHQIPALYDKLDSARQSLSDVLQWANKGFAKEMGWYNGSFGAIGGLLMQSTRLPVASGTIQLNGQTVPTKRYTAVLKQRMLGNLFGSLLGKVADPTLSTFIKVQQITFVTIDKSKFPQMETPEIFPGESMVGLEKVDLSGALEKQTLVYIPEN